MAGVFTCKSYQIEKAPQRITLRGDKTKKPEPAQHIIEFPGGAIDLSRLDDGSYWAHIILNRAQAVDDLGFKAALQRIRSEAERLRRFADFMESYIPMRQYAAKMKRAAPTNGSGHKPASL